jgi:prolyl oligopeptidase family protein
VRRTILAAAVLLIAAPAAHAERPGPPLLYAKAPHVPQLENRAPFHARPLLVSGTDAYRGGEYLYQDFLYDDHGADTGASVTQPGVADFSPASGDALYPDKPAYANNAADLVELRIKPTAKAIVYRVTLGAVLGPKAAVVGIGIDTDRSGGRQVPWPGAAGISSPGIDRFILAWGTRGRITRANGTGTQLPDSAVKIDLRTNQMTIRVARSLMDPGRRTWRYVIGTGLAAGAGFARPPGVFNLGFRFDEAQPRGSGTWFEADQAKALAGGTSGRFHADVSFARLADGANRWIHAPGRKQARIYPSRLKLHEGVQSRFPEFGGRLQPYLVFVPKTYPRTRRAGITWALHSLSATYTQYAVFSPNQQRQLGDDEGRFYVTPLGRGPDGWYTDEAEVDFFEVWADLRRHFRLDPTRVALSGYSMGGYGTYKLGLQWPDLFGAAFTTVGPPLAPGRLNTIQLIDNARWLPYLNWAGRTDALVPINLVRAAQARFDQLGLRNQLWEYPGGHLDLAGTDEWVGARAFLAGPVVIPDPRRVDYAFVPAADSRRLGLVHDHAYWVSGLRARSSARAQISAASSAAIRRTGRAGETFGRAGDPVLESVDSWNGDPPQPASVTGTEWNGIRDVRHANRLRLTLANLRRARIDGARAGLSGRRCVQVVVSSDGPARVALKLRLPPGARLRPGDDCRGATRGTPLGRGGATIAVSAGTGSWVILPG